MKWHYHQACKYQFRHEKGAVFYGDTRRNNITYKGAFAANVDPFTGLDISPHLTDHDDLAYEDVLLAV